MNPSREVAQRSSVQVSRLLLGGFCAGGRSSRSRTGSVLFLGGGFCGGPIRLRRLFVRTPMGVVVEASRRSRSLKEGLTEKGYTSLRRPRRRGAGAPGTYPFDLLILDILLPGSRDGSTSAAKSCAWFPSEDMMRPRATRREQDPGGTGPTTTSSALLVSRAARPPAALRRRTTARTCPRAGHRTYEAESREVSRAREYHMTRARGTS